MQRNETNGKPDDNGACDSETRLNCIIRHREKALWRLAAEKDGRDLSHWLRVRLNRAAVRELGIEPQPADLMVGS